MMVCKLGLHCKQIDIENYCTESKELRLDRFLGLNIIAGLVINPYYILICFRWQKNFIEFLFSYKHSFYTKHFILVDTRWFIRQQPDTQRLVHKLDDLNNIFIEDIGVIKFIRALSVYIAVFRQESFRRLHDRRNCRHRFKYNVNKGIFFRSSAGVSS